MASQIAEREDHVVVEDVQGEHRGCKSKPPGPSEELPLETQNQAEGCPSWGVFLTALRTPRLGPL